MSVGHTCLRRDALSQGAFLGFVFLMAVAGLLAVPNQVAAGDDARLWDALKRGEAIAIMRHALAPGFSDPANFALGDCSTQRNLSDEGRRQAAEIGARFRANGITAAHVVSSAWCRCQDTAQLLDLGPVETLPALNSFFENRDQAAPQTAALKAWLADVDRGVPLVLITHQVNISAFAGQPTRSGEVVVVRQASDGLWVAMGSIETH